MSHELGKMECKREQDRGMEWGRIVMIELGKGQDRKGR